MGPIRDLRGITGKVRSWRSLLVPTHRTNGSPANATFRVERYGRDLTRSGRFDWVAFSS